LFLFSFDSHSYRIFDRNLSLLQITSGANKNSIVHSEVKSPGNQKDGTNIYYILCDEYGSFDQLMQEYGYKNSEFKDYLMQNGFNISENSFNYSDGTHIILSNLMSLDYVANNDSTVVEKAFGISMDNHTAMLENVVSRKKQILPPILDMLK